MKEEHCGICRKPVIMLPDHIGVLRPESKYWHDLKLGNLAEIIIRNVTYHVRYEDDGQWYFHVYKTGSNNFE